VPFAIELYFDPVTEQAMRAVWHTLAAAGLTATLPASGARPHVSLAVCPTLAPEAYRDELAGFARGAAPLDLTLASVGTFPGAEGVVFLAPVVTRPLLRLHAALHRRLASRAASWPYYRPGHWVPHCTVAADLPPERVPSAVDLCRRAPLPLRGRLEAVGLVAFRPVAHLYTYPLGVPPAA